MSHSRITIFQAGMPPFCTIRVKSQVWAKKQSKEYSFVQEGLAPQSFLILQYLSILHKAYLCKHSTVLKATCYMTCPCTVLKNGIQYKHEVLLIPHLIFCVTDEGQVPLHIPIGPRTTGRLQTYTVIHFGAAGTENNARTCRKTFFQEL